jgi:SAM-dependent methyltransferase
MSYPTYTDKFLDYAALSSAYSAAVITSILHNQLKIESVLDVGCARGTWLRAWREQGVRIVRGVDGGYVDPETLEISQSNFTPVNLNHPFDLQTQFDLVQSLEVGEHISEIASDIFVEALARHARFYILFSAAPPGQGGEHHINEKPYEFWRQKFERLGLVTVDAIRSQIAHDSRISYWYRYNTLLFVRNDAVNRLSDAFRAKIVRNDETIKDISPVHFRLRKALVRRLPPSVRDGIAKLKSRVLPTGRI